MCEGAGVRLRDLFVSRFNTHRRQVAVVDDRGQSYTYEQVGADANRLAHHLIATGVRSGDAVALLLPNIVEFVVADQAVIRVGAAKVAVNGMLALDEQCHVLRASGARVAVVGDAQLAAALRVQAEGGSLESVITVGVDGGPTTTSWTQALVGRADTTPCVDVDPQSTARISFTGGTTGLPKAIRHRSDRVAINLLAHIIEMELAEGERMLLTTPLAHASGLFMEAALLRGGTVHLGNGFDAADAVRRIRAEQITYLFLVPTMLYRLLDALEALGGGIDSVRTVLYGAAPVNPDRLQRGRALLGDVFIQFYGQAEAPNFITRLGREDHGRMSEHSVLTSCGRATTMAAVRIVDEAGRPLNPGAVGEVVTATPYTMVGYIDNAEATDATLRGGWLHTGDLGWMDEDGFVYLVDRAKDMIISGGMNVYCSEVERAVAELDGVADVAVFGVPDPEWGEAVMAAVVAAPGAIVDPAQIRDHCRTVLARYKVPKVVATVPTLPLTSVGKHDKRALRASWPPAAELDPKPS